MDILQKRKGLIFACTNNSEDECFKLMLLGTNKLYADNVLQLTKGDILFLYNMDKDVLYGIFYAKSNGGKNLVLNAWKGKYPYQVYVESKKK